VAGGRPGGGVRVVARLPRRLGGPLGLHGCDVQGSSEQGFRERQDVGSVIKKRRKRMAKKKHRKLLKRTRVQRRRLGK